MPAQRKKRRSGYKPSLRRKGFRKRKKKKIKFPVPLVALVLLVALTIYLYLRTGFWNTKSKLSIAIKKDTGEVLISTFDPTVSEITNITIPGNTEVHVARSMGTLQIKNVWQLGENQGLDGKLLSETITRHFKFPVVAWADNEALGFTETNLISLMKAAILPYKTNLKIGDRVRIAIFAAGVNNPKRAEIDLSETSYLAKTILVDGDEGYTVAGSFPKGLLVVFSDPQISNKATTVKILDASSKVGLAQELGEVIGVFGAKVASVDKVEGEEFDCEVKGKEREIVEKVAKLFSCRKVEETIEGGFDLEIAIGEEFARRF